jgi:hypothetical protein
MARIIVKFEKEDITTQVIGKNLMIVGDHIDLVFSKEAMEELIKDYISMNNNDNNEHEEG